MLYYNAETQKLLDICFFVRKGILFSKKRNHFMAEFNAFANENIYDDMRISCVLSVK
jgi:microcystin degradation protein MlrC